MWEIIRYSDEKKQEMIEMTKEYYGADNDISDPIFVEHQYFSNPEGNAYIDFAYDFENNRMAGQYMVIPREFLVNGKKVKGVLSLNTLTRETYRGQGVFTKLADAVYDEAADDGVMFCYGAPNQNSFPGFIKKLGFNHIGDVPLYLKILNPVTLVIDKVFSRKKSNFYTTRLIDADNIIEITKDNMGLLDAFFDKINSKYSVMGIRSREFVEWRYLDIPKRDYKIYAYCSNGEITSYSIIRITAVADMNCGMIVDYMYLNDYANDAKKLLKFLLKIFKKNRIGLVGCLMLQHTLEAKILKESGFFVCPSRLLPQPFPIILKEFKAVDSELLDFNKWFFTMGDYDAV